MRSSAMTHKFGALTVLAVTGAAVMVFHSAAFAQQSETADKAAPAPAADASAKQQPAQDLPPEYGPPPGYGHAPAAPPAPPTNYPSPPAPPANYPPPYYGPYYYAPPAYPPPPPRYYRPRYYQPAPVHYEPIAYRPFFFGFGFGVGGVGIKPGENSTSVDASRAGFGYNLRFGFGLSPRWALVLSADGAQAYFNSVSVNETAWTIGPQFFILPKLYVRAGIGAATYSDDSCTATDSYGNCVSGGLSDSGTAGTLAVGMEFMQSYHSALALEAAGTVGVFPNKDKVSTIGINFILLLF